jgi:hypothetical protein
MDSNRATDTVRNSVKVKAALESLRSKLEEKFAITASGCWEKLSYLERPVGTTDDTDPIVLAAVHEWLHDSLECVSEPFKTIYDVAKELLPDREGAAKLARELTWEAIYPSVPLD